MKVLVLLSLFVVCSQALHATRPLFTPGSKTITQTAQQLRPRAQAKKCHGLEKKDACIEAACVYCVGKTKDVPEGCYHPLESLRVPKNVFECSGSKDVLEAAKQKAVLRNASPSDPCEGLAQAACDAKDECTWCKSAAVPSSCYTRAQSKFLPPAVFQCDKPAPTTMRKERRNAAAGPDKASAARNRRRTAAGRTAESGSA